MELLTADGMRAAERAAIESGEVSGLELMERAGRGVVATLLERRPEMAAAPGEAAVLCGPGNNGGDGFVVARLLADRGWRARVVLLGDPDRLPPDAAANASAWRAVGGEIRPWGAEALAGAVAPLTGARALLVEALFGTGLTRHCDGPLGDVEAALKKTGATPFRLSVDTPAGLCSDTGRMLGEKAFAADLFVTFHRPKTGHHLCDCPLIAADMAVVDIGLRRTGEADAALVEAPAPGRLAKRRGHKFSHGHALVLAGGVGRGGAGRLAARAALRVGAGLVTLLCPPSALQENAARLDAVMLRATRDAEGLAEMLEDRRVTAVALGMGLGVGARARDLAAAALGAEPARAIVLDADALTSFAEAPEALFALTRERPVILVPHPGEFARLFPDLAAALSARPSEMGAISKIEAARRAAARAGCAVLLKGHDTAIAAPDGRVAVHAASYERAAPWLATAGAGDVLAGLVAGLAARGEAATGALHRAACDAAWLHAEAARRFGPGLIAEDLPEALPALLRDLGA